MEQSDRTMYEFIAEVRSSFATIKEQLTQLIEHAKETNGRVHKLEITTARLEKDMDERDANLEKMIQITEKAVKIWALKMMLIVTLFGSFVWIKESRDEIIHIIHAIF